MTPISIETERAGAYPNATEADLHRCVMRIGAQERYVIVHRDGDERFAQAAVGDAPGKFVVEYSLKSGQLRKTTVTSRDEVYDLLSGWAFERPRWKQGHTWESLTNDWVIDMASSLEWHRDGTDDVVTLAALGLEARGASRALAKERLFEVIAEVTADSPEMRQRWHDWARAHVVRRSELKR